MNRSATPTERLRLRVLAGLALGVLHAAAFAPPLHHWWVQSAAMAALLALATPGDVTWRPGRLAVVWAAFGLGHFTFGLSWLHTSMHVYGGMPSGLAVAALLLFAAYLTLFTVLALLSADALLRRLRTPSPPHGALAVTVAGAWGLAELLRGWALTGFPWLSIGYAHIDGPLAGLAPLIGVYGVGAAAAALAAVLGLTTRRLLTGGLRPAAVRDALGPIVACALLLAAAALTGRVEHTQATGSPLAIRLIQGNVPQQMKFDRARTLQAMEDYTRMVEGSTARLTVLPETAWTVPWDATPAPIADRLRAHVRSTSSAIAIGMPLAAAAEGPTGVRLYTNSVQVLTAETSERAPARYDKRHLVPFGEFVPPGFRWFVDLMRIPLGDFGRGATLQAPIEVGGQRVAFNICYEDLFGAELLPAIRLAAGATVLVNVSNIAWFGDSHALPQHLAIGRMRALETGRPMLRATNTGVTAVIDHRGRVREVLPSSTQGVLDAQVQGTSGLTPYAMLGDLGIALACALALAATGWVAMRRERRKR